MLLLYTEYRTCCAHSKGSKASERLKLTFILMSVKKIKSEDITQLMHNCLYTDQDDVIIILGLHFTKELNNHFVCSRLIFDVSTSFICHIPCTCMT